MSNAVINVKHFVWAALKKKESLCCELHLRFKCGLKRISDKNLKQNMYYAK